MKLSPELQQHYAQDPHTALEAQHRAYEITFGPIVFQVSRLMVAFGILDALSRHKEGLSQDNIARQAGISDYAAQVLLEASLGIGTVLWQNDRYHISKTGRLLLNDPIARVNLDFVHEICYQGMFDLEATLRSGRPEGLKVFGDWPTIYEGLSQLPESARQKWLAFDHYYSDTAFAQALRIVFARAPRTLLDVGGNTGRWALQCVAHDAQVAVTIMDLPQQLALMQKAVAGKVGAERIHGHPGNLLDPAVALPQGFDAIWMSQFLDCFSQAEVTGILCRAARAMNADTDLYIMEPLWDRQKYAAAAYCLTQTTLYFTALANGNSKLFASHDLLPCIRQAGLAVVESHDGLGQGHTLLRCRLAA